MRNKHILLTVLIVLVSVMWVNSQNFSKSDLRVLYVGGTPDIKTLALKVKPEVIEQSVRDRMAAFEQMLNQYFKSVTVVKADEYKPQLSYDYDVTIMDGVPQPVIPGQPVRDDRGEVIGNTEPVYFPEDFDRPVVTIAEMGSTLGRAIGLKSDWYCLCLDADAHHFRREHPVFQGPFPVVMTIRMRPTPAEAYHFAYYADGAIPDSIPMWKVQTRGYKTDKSVRVGMVSRPWGFEDSPDAEYISSGVCLKTLDAVAIGRHGNFLHWGFAASPTDMTEEAKAVFANAVVYISRFAGQGVISRKYSDRLATRDYLRELKYLATHQAWQEKLESQKVLENAKLEKQKAARQKQERGETLNRGEQRMLAYQPAPPITYEEFVKRYHVKDFERFGTDEKAYIEYYDDNRDYFYGGDGTYELVVDEDVKSLGIPNNDQRLLERCIGMLEQGQQTEKALRILERYTLCRFSTPGEWRKWYNENKNRLFFTESGGWLFMVNSRDKNTVGNDYHIREGKHEEQLPEIIGETDDKNPVLISVGVIEANDGSKEVVVRMKIHPGYHTYAFVAKEDPFIVTTLDIELPKGYQKDGIMNTPGSKTFNDQGTAIYEGELVFRQKIKGIGKGQVKCRIEYQCCDNHICMPPVEKEYVAEIK